MLVCPTWGLRCPCWASSPCWQRSSHDVVACGSGLMTFLGLGEGVAVVAMSNMVAMGSAVAIRVRPPPLGWVIAASHPADAASGLGRELVAEGLNLSGEVRVGGGKRGIRSNELLLDDLLIRGSTGKIVEGVVDGVKEAGVESGGVG